MANASGMRWVRIAAWLTLAAALLALLAGPINRFGVLDFRGALTLLKYAAMAGGAGAALCLIGAVMTRPGTGKPGFGLAVAGLIAGGAAFAVPVMMMQTAKRVPPIHDISTDTDSPPAFVDVVPMRANAANPPEYAGTEAATQQKSAYPDLRTVRFDDAPGVIFDRTLTAVKALGWDVVASNADEGRIEATETTAWFGFKDDVVVRIVADGEGSALDVRSKSRVGISDLGANAARIRKLIERVKAG